MLPRPGRKRIASRLVFLFLGNGFLGNGYLSRGFLDGGFLNSGRLRLRRVLNEKADRRAGHAQASQDQQNTFGGRAHA
jgi:hypothetical protein